MGLVYNTSIVRDGLVLHLDAANVKSYPGSGATWFDLSGRGNNGTLTGTPISGGTTNFTGSQFATIPFNASDFTFNNEMTVSILLRPNDGNDSIRRNPFDMAYGGAGTWTHETNGSINNYYGSNGGNAQTYASLGSPVVAEDEWAFMTTVRDISNVVAYKNGTGTSTTRTTDLSVVTGTNNIRIGTGYAGSYIGNIDIVMVYNRALTPNEVIQNFEATRGRYGL